MFENIKFSLYEQVFLHERKGVKILALRGPGPLIREYGVLLGNRSVEISKKKHFLQ